MAASRNVLLLLTLCCLGMCWTEVSATCRQITLNSNGYAYRRQTVSQAARVTSMTVNTRNSRSACIPGESFGYYGTDIWVNNGCRARFNVCYVSGANTQVSCSSQSYRRAVCAVGHPVESVSIKQHRSSSPCVEGFSFRHVGNNVVVSNGCRAVFNVGYLLH